MTVASAPTRAVAVRAHAKINLDLRVLGARPDGFHELRTVFQALALHDTVECVPRPGPLSIECDAPGVPLDGSNLIWRAAEALWRVAGREGPVTGVCLRLHKRIPLQGGLGGGSADAAATLRALVTAWRLVVSAEQLAEMASSIGSDVPFFLAGGTALGLGRGDEIYPLVDMPRHWVVLLVPGFGVSTADAYGWYDAERDTGGRDQVREAQFVPGPWPSRAAQMINDLEAPIARHHPEIDQMKAVLRRYGAAASAMSGSGSTVYGLFQKKADATTASEQLAGSGWRVLVTESLGRVAYARLSRPTLLRLADAHNSRLQ